MIAGKGQTPADCSPLTMIVGDRRSEAEITLAVGQGALAGLTLFYSERMFCGIGFGGGQMRTYNYGQEQVWMRQPVAAAKVWVRVRNEDNVVTFFYSTDGQAWVRHPWRMEVSGYHHNVFGGFLSLKLGVFCAGMGEVALSDFVYRGL